MRVKESSSIALAHGKSCMATGSLLFPGLAQKWEDLAEAVRTPAIPEDASKYLVTN